LERLHADFPSYLISPSILLTHMYILLLNKLYVKNDDDIGTSHFALNKLTDYTSVLAITHFFNVILVHIHAILFFPQLLFMQFVKKINVFQLKGLKLIIRQKYISFTDFLLKQNL